jgi:hypothetical protein
MAAIIHRIPQEIVDNITELLPIADLKNSRFISPSWNSDYTRRCLYRTVILRMNFLSYRKLQAIAQHSQFCEYVEYIIYDLRAVEADPFNQSLTRWKKKIAGAGLGLQRQENIMLMKQLSVVRVEKCHRNFCQYIDGQELFESFEDEAQMFSFQYRLPNLKGIEYSYRKSDTYFRIELPNLDSLPPLARWMLVEPDALMGESKAEEHFWQWINSVDHDKLKELCLTDIKAHHFRSQYFANATYCQFVQSLERLCIRITRHSCIEDYSGLVHILGLTHDLKQLDLSFGVSQGRRGAYFYMGLQELVKSDKQWGQLTTLSLDGFSTSEEYIRHLLLRLAPSLHSLSLANITFKKRVMPGTVASQDGGAVQFLNGGNGSQGSWVKLVIFLHNEMKLKSVSFQGLLCSPWDDCWAVADQMSGDCLKDRVQQYAAAARYPDAKLPFRTISRPEKMTPVGRGGARRRGRRMGNARLVVEDDESWQSVKLR